MAKVYLWDKSQVEVTPDNWNELALRERQLREAAFGRPLTFDEKVSIIRAFQAKGLEQQLPDYRAGVDQAADSVTYAREAEKLYVDPVRNAASAAWDAAADAAGTAGQTIAIAVLILGGLFLFGRKKR